MTEATAAAIVSLIHDLFPKLGWHDQISGEFMRRIQRLYVEYEQAEASLKDFVMTATGYKVRSPDPATLFAQIAKCAPTTQFDRPANDNPHNPNGEYRAHKDHERPLIAARFWKGRAEDSPVEVMTLEQYNTRTGRKSFGSAGQVAKDFVNRLSKSKP